MGLSLISLIWFRPRWDEWSLLVPAIAWTALMMNATFNIGWRHFLPAYFFWMMLSTRAINGPAVANHGVVLRGPRRVAFAELSPGLSLLHQLAAQERISGDQRQQHRLGPGFEGCATGL